MTDHFASAQKLLDQIDADRQTVLDHIKSRGPLPPAKWLTPDSLHMPSTYPQRLTRSDQLFHMDYNPPITGKVLQMAIDHMAMLRKAGKRPKHINQRNFDLACAALENSVIVVGIHTLWLTTVEYPSTLTCLLNKSVISWCIEEALTQGTHND